MLDVRSARTGQKTAVLGGVWLHSRYDPEAEAARYAAGVEGPAPSTLILLGGELGHVSRALLRRFPGSRLLEIFYDSEVFSAAGPVLPHSVRAWHPGSAETLPEFLHRQVGELDAEGLKILEWPPTARACPEGSLEANRQVAQLLKELRGSLATTAALGRRWLANTFRNFVALEDVRPLPHWPGRRPVVIAASGPSLAEALPLIARHRSRLLLWALPSAAPALHAAGLTPDLVVLTDPGYFAVYHLHGALPEGTPLAMPVSAGPGAWRIGARVSYFNQDTVFEREVLAAARVAGPTVLPSGTVSASALQLALGSTAGPVVFAGLDLAFRDVHSHARPNAVERLLVTGSSRLAPLHHRLFAHAAEQAPRILGAAGPGSRGPARSNLALDTYAGWFAQRRAAPGRALYRLAPSVVPLPGLAPLSEQGLSALCRDAGASASALSAPPRPYPARAQRRAAALAILRSWIADMQAAARALAAEPAGAVGGLLGGTRLASLLYFCSAARAAELRRRLRLSGAAAAAPAARALLSESADFLGGLLDRLEQSP